MLVATVSCNKHESTDAENLYSEAETLLASNKPESTIALIDSISKKYPGEIELQRKAMHLRTLADSVVIDKEEILIDSALHADSIVFTTLQNEFIYVKNKEMVEGYYIDKSLSSNSLFERTGIEPRVDENGNMFIVSCLFGKNYNHTYLSALCNKGTSQTKKVEYDDNLNYHYTSERGKCEMVTFLAETCTDFTEFIKDNSEEKITIEFCGDKKHSTTLNPTIAKAIKRTCLFSKAMISGKNATAKKIYIAKKREIIRLQISRTKLE